MNAYFFKVTLITFLLTVSVALLIGFAQRLWEVWKISRIHWMKRMAYFWGRIIRLYRIHRAIHDQDDDIGVNDIILDPLNLRHYFLFKPDQCLSSPEKAKKLRIFMESENVHYALKIMKIINRIKNEEDTVEIKNTMKADIDLFRLKKECDVE